MRTDRELLELAAKAVGIQIDEAYTYKFPPTSLPTGYMVIVNNSGGHSFWNPLDDDGDALRLAVTLRMDVTFNATDVCVFPEDGRDGAAQPVYVDDPYAATRRAIVRAAAEIGAAL